MLRASRRVISSRQIAVHHHLGAGVNSGQGIAEVMHDGRRQPSDSRDALLPDQFLARLADRFAHALERPGQPPQFVLAAHVDLIIVVLFRDFGRRSIQLRDRLHDLSRHQVSDHQRRDQRQQPERDDFAPQFGHPLPRPGQRPQNVQFAQHFAADIAQWRRDHQIVRNLGGGFPEARRDRGRDFRSERGSDHSIPRNEHVLAAAGRVLERLGHARIHAISRHQRVQQRRTSRRLYVHRA